MRYKSTNASDELKYLRPYYTNKDGRFTRRGDRQSPGGISDEGSRKTICYATLFLSSCLQKYSEGRDKHKYTHTDTDTTF